MFYNKKEEEEEARTELSLEFIRRTAAALGKHVEIELALADVTQISIDALFH